MLSNYERILLFNPGPSVQASHEPLLLPTTGHAPGTFLINNHNMPGNLMQQLGSDLRKWEMLLQSKDQLLKQNKELIEK